MYKTETGIRGAPLYAAIVGVALALTSLTALTQIKAPAPERPGTGAVLSKPIKLPPKREETTEERNRRIATLPGAATLRGYVDAYETRLAAYRQAHDGYFSGLGRCHARTYSADDQRAAGCTQSDTVQQCSDKLLRRCMEPSVRSYTGAADQLNSALNAMRFSAQQGQNALSRISEQTLGAGR